MIQTDIELYSLFLNRTKEMLVNLSKKKTKEISLEKYEDNLPQLSLHRFAPFCAVLPELDDKLVLHSVTNGRGCSA